MCSSPDVRRWNGRVPARTLLDHRSWVLGCGGNCARCRKFFQLPSPHFEILTPRSKLGSWVTGPPNTRSFPRGKSIRFGESCRRYTLYYRPEASGQIHPRIRHASRVRDVYQLDCHFGVYVRRVEGVEDDSPSTDLFGTGYDSEVARFYPSRSCYRTMYSRYAIWYARPNGWSCVNLD